jgi:hypothetical protein
MRRARAMGNIYISRESNCHRFIYASPTPFLRPSRSFREHHIGCSDDMLRAIRAPALRCQPATLIAVVINLDDRNRLADDESIGRQGKLVLKGLPKGPQWLVVAVCVNRDLFNQLVQSCEVVVAPFVA